VSSPRRAEIVEAAYRYVLGAGLAGASLRPLAEAVGSSTGVLRFLFGSKDGLVAAVLERAREDELALLATIPGDADLPAVARSVWRWLGDPEHRGLLRLWTESYAASLQDDAGPWSGFAAATVRDWLAVLARAQPARVRNTAAGRAQRTAVLAVLRGAMLDLLATGDRARVDRAVEDVLRTLGTRDSVAGCAGSSSSSSTARRRTGRSTPG
jgi:AcrR family transcriptional regulator